MYKFKLYVAGQTPNSVNAVRNIKAFLDNKLKDQYSLSIIDVLENPQQAEEDKIIISPTLIKILPPPPRRIIGDLRDEKRLLEVLFLRFSKDSM